MFGFLCARYCFLDVSQQHWQLLILLVIVVWDDRHSVLELEEVGVCSIVDQDDVLQGSILQHPQIFDVHALLSLPALLTEQAMANELSFGVQMIEDDRGVTFMAGGKNNNFTNLG